METQTVKSKIPKLSNSFFPDWYNRHGIKMKVVVSSDVYVYLKNGDVANLTITKEEEKGKFQLKYEIRFSIRESIEGIIILNKKALSGAFGLSDYCPNGSEWLIERYGGNSAYQGRYIRWEDFLNLPCPGTSHDGDPNLSIFLDGKIKMAVKNLLDSK